MLNGWYRRGMVAVLLAASCNAYAVPHTPLNALQSVLYERVAQPTPGGPVRLHGVIDTVDSANHRIGIVQLSGFEYFWGPTVRNCAVDPNLDISALRPGTQVAFTLSRDRERNFYVSEVERH